jgi:hypothetical protein
MAYYLVSRMPPGETKLIQAPSALEAARASQTSATTSHRASETYETYMVSECDSDGVKCCDPVHFTADELFAHHHP